MIGLQACIDHAASRYAIPPASIEAVIEARHPADGIGVMGIAPAWLPALGRYGFDVGKVLGDSCSNVIAGAWILAANPESRVGGEAEEPEATSRQVPDFVAQAEVTYHVPDGDVVKVLSAAHGADTYGPMGIPARWIPLLVHYGFNSYAVENDYRTGLIAGIWILGVERLTGYETGFGASGTAIKYSSVPPAQLVPFFREAAEKYALPVELLYAVAAQESGFFERAVSSAGALGLMQLMPDTAAGYRVADPFDAAQNIDGGAAYLADLEKQFGGNLALVLAAYNAGSRAVVSYGNRIPPFTETQNYVPSVLGRYQYYLHNGIGVRD